jgi:NAD(P)-dependent dehydrogenase (short-subunit alcohol dehydrogenase family)
MQLGLKGRSALVTGASKGIGRAIALQLAEEGVDVAIAARSERGLELVRSEIAARAPVTVRVFPLDLSSSRSVAVLAAECAGVDILVNNAGAIPRGRIDEIDEARWRTAWDLKVFGYINMTRAFYALMKARGKGVIINILGNGGERVDAGYICGAAGNAALMAFTRAMGGASHKDGIRVVGINPGPTATERLVGLMQKESTDRFGTPERWKELMKPFPFRRAGTPEEIAAMTALLASDLSAYTTGTVVTIDGGMANAGSLI